AMYSVSSPAVFDSETYRRTRGMGPFVPVVDESVHRRNLFEGLDAAPDAPVTAILLVADRDAPGPPLEGLVWLHAVGLDCSTAFRGVVVFDDLAVARTAAGKISGAALYTPTTERFAGRRAP